MIQVCDHPPPRTVEITDVGDTCRGLFHYLCTECGIEWWETMRRPAVRDRMLRPGDCVTK